MSLVCLGLTVALLGWPPAFGQESEADTNLTRRATVHLWVSNQLEVHPSVSFNFDAGAAECVLDGLNRALGCSLKDTELGIWEGETYINGWCSGPFVRDQLVVSGGIDPEPIRVALSELGVERVKYSFTHSATASSEAGDDLGTYAAKWGYGEHAVEVPIDRRLSPISTSFGYAKRDLWQVLWALLATMLVPALIVWVVTRRALRSLETDGTGRSLFGAMMAMYFAMIGSWAVWSALAWILEIPNLPAFAAGVAVYGDPLYDLIRNATWGVPVAVSTVLAQLAWSPAARRLYGWEWTRWETFKRTVAPVVTVVVPTVFVFTALNALGAQDYRNLVLFLFAALISLATLAGTLQSTLGATPQAVTHGPFRDRVFELAGQAGVNLRQLYVLPSRESKVANAFAIGNRTVMIAGLLLEKLTKREVDTVLAHELAHLKGKHGWFVAQMYAS